VDQRSRRAKSDRIDGEQLLRTLMAYCRGEPRVVRIVRVPSRDQEDTRRATREHDRLVKEQTAHTNRLKALLRLVGMAVGNPRRRDWLSWLAAQRDRQGEPVPRYMMAELTREHGRLMLVRKQLEELAAPAAEEELTPDAAEMGRRREHFLRLKSLGPAFTGTLTNEVFYKDFRTSRQVGSYFGLAPSPWKSGGIDREQGSAIPDCAAALVRERLEGRPEPLRQSGPWRKDSAELALVAPPSCSTAKSSEYLAARGMQPSARLLVDIALG
jgi:transposase